MGNITGNNAPAGFNAVRNAEEEEIDNDEEDEEEEEEAIREEETEEAWRLRREGRNTQTRLDFIKRLLAVAFFAGLGLIVIIVAATSSVPLIGTNSEDNLDLNVTTSSPTPLHGDNMGEMEMAG